MSLNNIQLPSKVIAELYAETLMDTGEDHSSPAKLSTISNEPIAPEGLRWLGNNDQKVLIVVNSAESVHLPDDQLQFLTNMLSACKMTIADVAIVNIHQQTHSYKKIIDQLKSRSALLFDVEPVAFELPINFPQFQIQPYAGCSFLYAPSLRELESDKVLKSKLWVSLRRLFNI